MDASKALTEAEDEAWLSVLVRADNAEAALVRIVQTDFVAATGHAAVARAPSTRRAYVQDWLAFSQWCAARALASLSDGSMLRCCIPR